ncbi:MAG: hypothetical protein LAO79_19685 [Acidobacteriia bacterium]|nr:hypothetical protein [Terriglobia bacterium]
MNLALPEVRIRKSAIHERLVRGFSQLQGFRLVRNHLQEPHFGQAVEDRIIWRELLELELQEIDEQIERLSTSTKELSH